MPLLFLVVVLIWKMSERNSCSNRNYPYVYTRLKLHESSARDFFSQNKNKNLQEDVWKIFQYVHKLFKRSQFCVFVLFFRFPRKWEIYCSLIGQTRIEAL